MDLLDAMLAFVTTADAGTLSAAGKRLGLSLPTISRKLSELETHLGTPLLIRSTRKQALTPAGAAYLPKARNILDEVLAAGRMVAGEHAAVRGELVVSAPLMLGRMHVLLIVDEYLSIYPEMRVRLQLTDRNADLIDDNVDVAVRIGVLADSALVAVRVGVVGRVVCGSPGYLAQVGSIRTPEDLQRLSCITFDCLDVPPVWRFAKRGREKVIDVPIRPRLSVNTAEAAIDAVIAGMGVTQVGSYQVAPLVAAGLLQLVLQEFEAPPLPVSLLCTSQGSLLRKTRAFLDLATAKLRLVLPNTLDPRQKDGTFGTDHIVARA